MTKIFEFVNAGAKRDFLALPDEIKKRFGADLNAVQQDKIPFSKIKNLASSVGPGVYELIENGSPAYRAIYCAKYNDTVFILHAFTKTTNGVDRQAMATVKARYKEMMDKIAQTNKKARR